MTSGTQGKAMGLGARPPLLLAALALLIAARSVVAQEPGFNALLERADAEDRLRHPRAAMSALQAAELLQPAHAGLLVRLSTHYADLIEENAPAPGDKGFAEKSFAYARRAVELDPKNARAHLALATAYGRLTDYVGNKQKLEYSKLLHGETLKSLELDPNLDAAWHVLGRWNFGVANVNAFLKALARLVYGGLPPASTADAIKFLKKASALAPRRIMHHSELARIYTELGQRELALAEWRIVLTLPCADKGDEEEKIQAEAELKKRR